MAAGKQDSNDLAPAASAAPPGRPHATLAAGVAILAIGAALVVARGRRHPTVPPAGPRGAAHLVVPRPRSTTASGNGPSTSPVRPAAGAAELALVAPLVVGAQLGDGTVAEITGVHGGFMHVLVRRGGQTFDLGIGLGREGMSGLRAGRYAVYILGSARPDPAAFPIADALARQIRVNADAVPPPGFFAGTLPASPR